MKDISLRPKPQLMNLFENVQYLESLPTTNRNAIVERALEVALKTTYINWRAVSEISLENNFNNNIPSHIVLKVDEDKFKQISDQIKEAFDVTKITIPYTLKLLLTLYYIHLKQQSEKAIESENVDELLDGQIHIDTLKLKNEYEQSLYSGKKRLLEMCRLYIKQSDSLKAKLIEQVKQNQKVISEFVDLKHFIPFNPQEIIPNEIFLAKVLAGIFIFRIESYFDQINSKTYLDQLVKKLESEFQTVGKVMEQVQSTDYYRNVYSRMMGGRL